MMLGHQEMEQLLVEHTGCFPPTLLASLLLGVCTETASLASICDKVSAQFQSQGAAFSAAGTGSSEAKEVNAVIEAWTEVLDKLVDMTLSLRPTDRKYILLKLTLDIIAVMQPVASPSSLLQVEMISSDLEQRKIKKKDLREFFICMHKLSSIDPSSQTRLVQNLKEHFVAVYSHDACLDIFIDEADHMLPEVSDLFFAKAVEAFNSEMASSKLSRIFNFFGMGGAGVDAKIKNLARLFSHCIQETKINGLTPVEAVAVITGLPALANMMRFLPRLRELDCLGAGIEEKAGLILDHVKQANLALAEGRVSLHLLNILKEEQRVERLFTLTGCVRDAQAVRELKTCINLRSEELAEYHRAADDVRKFATKFDDIRESELIQEVLAQFEADPETVELREVCSLRSRPGPIALQLCHVSNEDLKQVRRHNELYSSAVFRIIQDRVLPGITR
jgi:hypothetical protein